LLKELEFNALKNVKAFFKGGSWKPLSDTNWQ